MSTVRDIKTAYDLKYATINAGTAGYFWDRSTMRFFGDTMRNYGVRRVAVTLRDGSKVAAWELYRRRPVKHSLQASKYWECRTLKPILDIKVD